MYKRKIEKDIRCPLEYGLEVFGGKWNSRIICVLAASLLSLQVPFLPVHLLFINLLTDSLPAIALGLEPYHHDVMGKKPRPVKESILERFALRYDPLKT